jgi:hypothetical protein
MGVREKSWTVDALVMARAVESEGMAGEESAFASSSMERDSSVAHSLSASRMPVMLPSRSRSLSRSQSWSQSKAGLRGGLPMKGSENGRAGPEIGIGRPEAPGPTLILRLGGTPVAPWQVAMSSVPR